MKISANLVPKQNLNVGSKKATLKSTVKEAKKLFLADLSRSASAKYADDYYDNVGKIQKLPYKVLRSATRAIYGHVYGSKLEQPALKSEPMREALEEIVNENTKVGAKCRDIVNGFIRSYIIKGISK